MPTYQPAVACPSKEHTGDLSRIAYITNRCHSHNVCIPQAILIHVASLLSSVCVVALAAHTVYCMLQDKPVPLKVFLLLPMVVTAVVTVLPVTGATTVGKGTWGNSGFWVIHCYSDLRA